MQKLSVPMYLRFALLPLSILILGLSGYSVGNFGYTNRSYFWYSYNYYYGADANAVAVAVITFLCYLYEVLAMLIWKSLVVPLAFIVIETALSVWWFATWIAQAAVHGDNPYGYTPADTARASAAFGAVVWVIILHLTIIEILNFKNTRNIDDALETTSIFGINGTGPSTWKYTGSGLSSAGISSEPKPTVTTGTGPDTELADTVSPVSDLEAQR
ncbi:hypothetical protein CANCADRAFT_2314 [Tortispora caseinolytica NRRL Y-17796]|uniref:MARVEL domain-containing protein n=1 Tax=Tortispora caseinolytica NRRL Y-17796 TaxID=767744 RepID=A0A1E4TFV3_9ASCO|nr:hypothetical protein CANCADRAFT_2314 [Tortispora caseinolytica NRRL Y-17796]